jgi:hypothetical protein
MMIGVGLHPIADLPMMIGVSLPTTILVALLSIVLLVPATILPAIGGADILMGRRPTIVIATALPIVSMPLPISTAAPTTIVLLLHTVADSECGPISLSPHSSPSLSVWIPSAVPSLLPVRLPNNLPFDIFENSIPVVTNSNGIYSYAQKKHKRSEDSIRDRMLLLEKYKSSKIAWSWF